ncbi:MAG: hypothetical protein MK207_08965 [Saprospiraceae bacterium]|nr:hypothetical protein [Saprospiraceae bacterium]
MQSVSRLFNYAIIICCFLINSFILVAQNDNCIEPKTILTLQNSQFDEIRKLLNTNNWSFYASSTNENFEYFDFPINYNVVHWEHRNSYYGRDRIILYINDKDPNMIIFQTSYECFNNLLQYYYKDHKGQSEIQEDLILTVFDIKELTYEFREYKNNESYIQYSILVYNTKVIEEELKRIAEEEEAIRLAELEAERKKMEMCIGFINNGDTYFDEKKYELALESYQNAKSCDEFDIRNKIDKTKTIIKANKIKQLKSEGDQLIENKKYTIALSKFEAVLKLDYRNKYAKDKKRTLNEIIKTLSERKLKTFDYSLTNESSYQEYRNNLHSTLNDFIIYNKNGNLNFKVKIEFDTLGNNITEALVYKSSIEKFGDELKESFNNNILKPSSKKGFYINAKKELRFNCIWQTNQMKYKTWDRGSIAKVIYDEMPAYSKNKKANRLSIDFLKNNNIENSTCTFELKDMKINQKDLISLKLLDIKTPGPECALYSVIMPGLGTLKATNWKHGWGTFGFSIFTAGLAIGSKIWSDIEYNNYLNETDASKRDDHYEQANWLNKSAIVCGSISATIYLVDIILALNKGIKNKKRTKKLRNLLDKGPIELYKDDIKMYAKDADKAF